MFRIDEEWWDSGVEHRGSTRVRSRRSSEHGEPAVAARAAEFFPSEGDSAVVASGADFPDALAGGAAAAKLGAPLLLVPRPCQPAVVAAELHRLVAPRRIVLGGAAAISEVAASGGLCQPPPCAAAPSSAPAAPEPDKDESVAKSLTEIIRAPADGVPVTYRSDGTFTDAELDFVQSMIVGTR